MSFGYFDEKEKVKKRQPHKRTSEKKIKKETVKVVFGKFLHFKQKQNLRATTLNQHIHLFNNIEAFHFSKTNKPFCLSDITTEFISDYVYWLKNEAVKFQALNLLSHRGLFSDIYTIY